jgi:hypothetical protein
MLQTQARHTRPYESIAARRDAIEAEICKRILKQFLVKVWPIIEPEHPFVDNWHIDLICEDLEALERGDWDREIFNIPPGTLKSILIDVVFPAWVWARDARKSFVFASYSDNLTIRDNRKLRMIIESEWYSKHYHVKLVDDQNAKKKFSNTAGGWSLASSVGGTGTGEHPNYFITNDPITAQQARSATERGNANDWFDRTVSSRGIVVNVRQIVVMQRLDENDLSGHLLKRGGWKHLALPMRYEVKREPTEKDPIGYTPEPRDPRRTAGELLFPALFTEAKVKKLEIDLGMYGVAGQLQQRPSPEGGGLFKREWFAIVDAAPVVARRVRGWDTGGTEDGGDWTCGVRIAEANGIFYVEDVAREQVGPNGVLVMLKQLAASDGRAVSQREEREGGSAGIAVINQHLRLLVGYDYAGVTITGDKVTRSKPFRAQCEGGNVRLVRGPWNETYIRELCDFPVGAHDDQVDASGCAFNSVLLEPVPVAGGYTW